MKRIIMQSPVDLHMDLLNEEQQNAIKNIVLVDTNNSPMLGTISYNNFIILDKITVDEFDPDAITALNLPFILLGMWQWDGISGHNLVELLPLDNSFINFLPDNIIHDNTGNIINIIPPTLHIPHNWAGWETL